MRCSCCRKPIGALRSMVLNGMFAHVTCVEAVMREPGAMAVVTDLSLTTDDQLRTECERRFGGESFKQSLEIMNCQIGELTRECHAVEAERDEWKRRAEAADVEQTCSHIEPRKNCRSCGNGIVERFFALTPPYECGPGIDRMRELGLGVPADNALYVDPLDLLADDA